VEKEQRNALRSAVVKARRLLEKECQEQLEGAYNILPDGRILENAFGDPIVRARLLDVVQHHRAGGASAAEAVERTVREAAFTVLNRFAALKMAERRGLVRECISQGLQSEGLRELADCAPGLHAAVEDGGYRLLLEALMDEISLDLKVLFDRRDAMAQFWPRPKALDDLLEILNDPQVADLWSQDETIGWIYQYFNADDVNQMREESSVPRNSRELAVRNQFFTPRYVVEFLTDNTIGRIWYEMSQGQTRLKDRCRHLVRRPIEIFLEPGEVALEPPQQDNLSQEQLLHLPVNIKHRPLKDPREIRMLDPACGSMHFGLYAFDLFEVIYDEAWEIAHGSDEARKSAPTFAPFASLVVQYPEKGAFLADVPRLIIEHNLHGIDIDLRAAQIAGLSLWLRAQRTWQEQELPPQDRPRIRRSNIVCAEPMPGEEAFLAEFIEEHLSTTPEHKLLGQLVRRVFDGMELAGEAGSLLKIEEEIADAVAEAKQKWLAGPKVEQGRLFVDDTVPGEQKEPDVDVTGITDETFWERAEERIYAALQTYAEQAEDGAGYQRRLFADDAARGFAFIDLCRKRYDVILMNPPFGEPSPKAESLIRSRIESCNNIFCSFVVDSTGRLSDAGVLGAITDRSFVVKDSYEKYRRWLYDNGSPTLFIDLGWGVLDANVEACCYLVRPSPRVDHGLFLNLSQLAIDDKSGQLVKEVASTAASASSGFLRVSHRAFENIPHLAMSYFIPSTLMADFAASKNIGNVVAKTARGMSSGDTLMACRLFWEVPPALIGSKKPWNYANVGGGSTPFYRPQFMVFRYSDDWGPLRDLPGFSLKNVSLFWRSAVGWGKRTDILSAQLLPPGLITAEDGQVAVPFNDSDAFLLLGLLNSKYAQSAIHCICGGHKGPGYVGSIPFPASIRGSQARISGVAAQGFATLRSLSVCNETTLEFCQPLALSKKDDSHWTEDTLTRVGELLRGVKTSLTALDEQVFRSLGKTEIEQAQIVAIGPGTLEPRLDWPGDRNDLASALASYALGGAYGRWDIRFATGEKAAPELPDPFAPLPVCPPGQLQNEQGLPITKEEVRRLKEGGRWKYPIEIPWDGILVDDPGRPLDLEARVNQVLESIWKNRWEGIVREACEILGVRTLRDYFRKPAGFFADHLKRYSKSRRQAPIYWPLSTASGSYTIWIYYHRLTADTLFQVVAEHVDPKLRKVQEQRLQVEGGQRRADGREAAKLAKQTGELVEFEQELEEMKVELLRVAKLPYKPDLNDGVEITAAPLWKLFRLPAWRKVLEDTWKILEKGEYDWAHLSYAIWPDRVREKCKMDRSLAIAHDLEELYEGAARPPVKKSRKRK